MFIRLSKYATDRRTISDGFHARAWAFIFASSMEWAKSPSAYPATRSTTERHLPSRE